MARRPCYDIDTDASGWAIVDCLSQYDTDGKLYPIAYFSKELPPVECNYNIHDEELRAILRSINKWRGELIGLQKPSIIYTDHNNLRYFMTARKLRNVRLNGRWPYPNSIFV